jgi:hypothetical protein
MARCGFSKLALPLFIGCMLCMLGNASSVEYYFSGYYHLGYNQVYVKDIGIKVADSSFEDPTKKKAVADFFTKLISRNGLKPIKENLYFVVLLDDSCYADSFVFLNDQTKQTFAQYGLNAGFILGDINSCRNEVTLDNAQFA